MFTFKHCCVGLRLLVFQQQVADQYSLSRALTYLQIWHDLCVCMAAAFLLGCCAMATSKESEHAPIAKKVLSLRAYEEPGWHNNSRKGFLAIDARPKSSAVLWPG